MNKCPVCQNQKLKTVINKDNDEIVVNECLKCGHGFLVNTEEKYNSELYEYYEDLMLDKDLLEQERLNDNNYREILSVFKILSDEKSLLDVGCGIGGFVQFAQSQGWEAKGIDLSCQAVDLGRSLGRNIERMNFFDEQVVKYGQFDAITMFEFIEHVSNPLSFINTAAQYLKKGGVLYLTTPNFRALDRYILRDEWRVISKEHLNYFTKSSLEKMISCNEHLCIKKIKTKNISIQALMKIIGNMDFSVREKQKKITTNTRKKIKLSRSMRYAKNLANITLNMLDKGSTIIAVIERR